MKDSVEKGGEKQKPIARLYETTKEAFDGVRKISGPCVDTPGRPQTPQGNSPVRKQDHRGRYIPQTVNTDCALGRDVGSEERAEQVVGYQQQMAEAARPSTPSRLITKAASSVASVTGSIKGRSPSDNGDQGVSAPTGSRRGMLSLTPLDLP